MKCITAMLIALCLLAAAAGSVSAYDPSGITLLPENLLVGESLGFGLYSFRLEGGSGCGVMNVHGDFILDTQYKWVEQRPTPEGEPLIYAAQEAPVTMSNENGELWGVVRADGEWVLPCRYLHIGPFSEGLAFAEIPHPDAPDMQRLAVLVDMQGNEIPCPGFSGSTTCFSEGLAVLDSHEIINTKGEVLYSLSQYEFYQDMTYFSDGLMPARVPSTGRWGFVGVNGEMAIPAAFEDVGAFSSGLAPICMDGHWGYIDTRGQIVIEPAYVRAESFIGDAAAVYSQADGWLCIDTQGNFIALLGDGSGMSISFEGFSGGWAVSLRGGISTLFDQSGRIHLLTEGVWAWGCRDGVLQQLTQPLYSVGQETSVLIDTEGRRLTPEGWFVMYNAFPYDGCVLAFRLPEDGTPQYARIEVQPSQEQPAAWAKPYIDRLKSEAAVPAYLLDSFDAPAARDAFAALLFNVWHSVTKETVESTPVPFDDLSGSLYAAQVTHAFHAGLAEGMGERTFSPHDPLTREQMAKLIGTACLDVHGGTLPADAHPDFVDSGDISPWAAPYVAYCQAEGLLDGTGGGRFSPKETIDRQTALTAAAKLLERLRQTGLSGDDSRMMAGYRLEDDYFLLPEEQTQGMEIIREEALIEPDENGDYGLFETWYSDGDVALGVRTGHYTYEQSSLIHCITLLTARHQTPRGLRVGDSVEKCLSLYGKLPNESGQIEAGVLELTQESGIITSITLRAGS